MLTAKALLQASLGVGSFLKAPMVEAHPRAAAPTPVMVPIRSIGPRERDRIAQHLLALDALLQHGVTAGARLSPQHRPGEDPGPASGSGVRFP